jgi:hypothetical protein
MKKISTMQVFSNEILQEQKPTIGVDLGDRWSFYSVLDEAGKILLEQKVPTAPEAMKQTFGKIPRSLVALETGVLIGTAELDRRVQVTATKSWGPTPTEVGERSIIR